MNVWMDRQTELFFLLVTHCYDMISPSVIFHEHIPNGLGVMSQTQRMYYTTGIFSKGSKLKTKLDRAVFLVCNTLS